MLPKVIWKMPAAGCGSAQSLSGGERFSGRDAAADIGTEIVSGTAGLARTAVGVQTDVVTDTLGGLPEEDDSTSAGSRGRRQQT
jgi:hypothetical protein